MRIGHSDVEAVYWQVSGEGVVVRCGGIYILHNWYDWIADTPCHASKNLYVFEKESSLNYFNRLMKSRELAIGANPGGRLRKVADRNPVDRINWQR